MTTDPQPCHGDSDCCADLHRKVDRLLELLEDLHKARKARVQVETELRFPLDADGYTDGGRAYWM